jgi:TonB family protein
VLLNRLESGFLLFETPRGLVRAELSFRQRLALLWTFRNFRQLSLPLLNRREQLLVNSLFRHNANVEPYSDDVPVIGVIENFVPPPLLPEETVEATVKALIKVPVEAAIQVPNQVAIESPIQSVERAPHPFVYFAKGAPLRSEDEPLFSAEPMSSTSCHPARSEGPAVRSARRFSFNWPKLSPSRLATIIAMSLCVLSGFAWYRTQAIHASQDSRPFQQMSVQPISETTTDAPQVPQPVAPAPLAETTLAGTTTADATRVESPTDVTAPQPTSEINAETPAIAMPTVTHTATTPVARNRHSSSHFSDVTPKRTFRARHNVAAPGAPLSAAETAIQATRPPLRFAYPSYTDERARGKVALTARVESDGTVTSVKIISGPSALTAAAVRAVRHWRYRPYLKDGQPVATETNIVFSFFAADAISMSFPPTIPSAR